VAILPISDDNYETLMRGKTLEEYVEFFQENFGEAVPELAVRWKARMAAEQIKEEEAKAEEAEAQDSENIPEEKPDVQQDTNEQIPGQDEIENHPEYMPEKKTDQQIIEDAKRTIDTIRVSLSGWEYTIPQNTLTAVLERVDYLKETLQGLVKGEADESNV